MIAVKVLFDGSADQSSGPSQAAAGVLGWPGGQWIVGLAGVGFVIVCFLMAYDGVSGSFLEEIEDRPDDPRRPVGPSASSAASGGSRVPSSSPLVGYFLIRTAIDFNPTQAIGIDGALRKVAQEPDGSWLLGAVAVGLILFAASLARRGSLPAALNATSAGPRRRRTGPRSLAPGPPGYRGHRIATRRSQHRHRRAPGTARR